MSSNFPKVGIDTSEGIQAGFAALGIGQDLVAKIRSMPANPSAVQYARIFGAAEDGIQMAVAKLVDQLRADAKD